MMSFWDIFKSSKDKPLSETRTLRMGDKKYLMPLAKEKYKGTKPIALSVAGKAFQLVATFEKTTKQVDNQGKVVCHRLMCLESGRMFTLEKEIFDRLFVAY